MANTIKIKRSAVSGKVPTTTDLELGELAVNTFDGKLYTKKDNGTASIVQIGNAAATADTLSTARTISLGGDVSGSTSFDGSANVTITATVADDSHNHIISNVDGLQTALDAKAPLASPALTGTPTAPTAAVGTDTTQLATTAFVNAEIANDAPSKTGTGASGTWGISVTGNAATATTLQTARTINGTSFNGSANITITANTSNTLSVGSYLTGSNFNGSAATTWAVDATTTATANKIVARDASGDTNVRYLYSSWLNVSHSQGTYTDHTEFYSGTSGWLYKNTASGMRSSLSVPHLAGNNTFTLAQRGEVDALSSASTITPDFNNSNNFSISLSTNTTIANPSNLTAGQSGAIAITYNGTYTVAFGSYWKFASGTAPTATSTNGKTDLLVYYVESSTRISAQLLLNMGG